MIFCMSPKCFFFFSLFKKGTEKSTELNMLNGKVKQTVNRNCFFKASGYASQESRFEPPVTKVHAIFRKANSLLLTFFKVT